MNKINIQSQYKNDIINKTINDISRHLIISSDIYVKSVEAEIETNKISVYGKFTGNDVDLCNYYTKQYY